MSSQPTYRISELSFLFSDMSPKEYSSLVASIRVEGLRVPIAVWRGEVIDGRHRLAACAEAGVEPRFEILPDETDPVHYLLSMNAARRHQDPSQRAVVAYLVSAQSGPGRPRAADGNCANVRSYTQGQAAAMLGVSRRLVTHAARVLSEESSAVPELRQAVVRGQVRLADAGRVLDQPPEVQRQAVDMVLKGEASSLGGALRKVLEGMTLREDRDCPDARRSLLVDDAVTLHPASVADLHDLVEPASVDAIVTQPPSWDPSLSLFSDLAAFAARALRPTGMMAVVGNGLLLPSLLERLDHPDLNWVGEFDMLYHGPPSSSGRPHWVRIHRQPLLIYGKEGYRLTGGDDLLEVPSPDELPQGRNRNEAAMELVVARFARPGQVVCDPIMLDRSGTALAARELGCSFIGAERNAGCLNRIRARLAVAGG